MGRNEPVVFGVIEFRDLKGLLEKEGKLLLRRTSFVLRMYFLVVVWCMLALSSAWNILLEIRLS